MTDRHAGPPPDPDAPVIPEPTYAERARTMTSVGHTGALATLSRRHPGHPFGSVMPYALDDRGEPLFLISSMAMHTQNLHLDPRASLLVTQESAGDPLAAGRVTLLGEARLVPESELASARATYLARHERAAYWVDFGDFAFWRLAVAELYFVGGFAAMDWVSADDYRQARPDPLAEIAPGILEHMNRDHADALVTLARAFGNADAEQVTMVGVDRLGFKVYVRAGERSQSLRIAFPREVTTAGDSRQVLVEMVREARRRQPAST